MSPPLLWRAVSLTLETPGKDAVHGEPPGGCFISFMSPVGFEMKGLQMAGLISGYAVRFGINQLGWRTRASPRRIPESHCVCRGQQPGVSWVFDQRL